MEFIHSILMNHCRYHISFVFATVNIIQIYTLAPVAGWNCNTRSYMDCTIKMGKDNNHVRTARAVYCDHCDVVIVTSRLVATWCHRLKCPPGWSDPPSCAVSLDPGNGSLDPGGHLCPLPVNSPTNYLRMTSSQPVKKRLPKSTIHGFRG